MKTPGAAASSLAPGARNRDDAVVSDAGMAWSDEIGQASWIGERLAPFGAYTVASVIPAGFESYARVLHPAEEPLHGGDRVVRWAEVAAWSGLPLRPDSQFHSIALPQVRPEADAPWHSQGPHQGSLYPPDALVLADILRAWTTTPQQCWFCVWDGYGWDGVYMTASDGTDAPAPGPGFGRLPDPVPAAVRDGPRVELPNRDYLLYRGPVEAALATVSLSGGDQVANLWWPQDRAWFVATEIDLAWTYVGGPAGLIGQLISEARIEALPAGAGRRAGRDRGLDYRAGAAAGRPAPVRRQRSRGHLPRHPARIAGTLRAARRPACCASTRTATTASPGQAPRR